MISDAVITTASFSSYLISETGLYSFLGLAIRSFMIDNFIESFNLSKYFNVVCDNPEPICDFIVHTLGEAPASVLRKAPIPGKTSI